ncbi:thymidine phosphorylase [Aedoeadaptatus coxii]|uniref:Pyrimidine-nucleoside phosphorylase n=1 Tax=Aedoeadaptatus coxii TaxID=755172 RepID=A0A134ABQ8_9FIRM|nr:thymidine phosphorylase [Peptoniphilus coxii]KXB65142.1 pyrimidine-nucleoside phosphorylase [Peptoniphilus coxii]
MSVLEVIEKKKHGVHLTTDEIKKTIDDYVSGVIKDYQMSALLMAIYFNGMNDEEINALTASMIDSGDTVDLSSIKGTIVDKHSTGGVGDTTTLILGPLLSAYGLPFGKMSGRGLGHTGGTLDKLESIPGLHVDLSVEEIIEATNNVGMAVAGQTANITPADKKLYALRDATATVDAIPLIASSIMSKKLAIHGDCLLLDVKVGDGAFMRDKESALTLAKTMVSIGENFGRKTVAILTRMDQPLGKAVGNGLEVQEAIDTLRGEGPEDLTELCIGLAVRLIAMTCDDDKKRIEHDVRSLIKNGKALEQFRRFVENQGGDGRVVEDPSILPKSTHSLDVKAVSSGYIQSIPAHDVGILARDLGAGRITMDDTLDMAAGIYLHKKVGDKVEKGDVLATLYSAKPEALQEGEKRLDDIIKISSEAVHVEPLIIDEVYRGF